MGNLRNHFVRQIWRVSLSRGVRHIITHFVEATHLRPLHRGTHPTVRRAHPARVALRRPRNLSVSEDSLGHLPVLLDHGLQGAHDVLIHLIGQLDGLLASRLSWPWTHRLRRKTKLEGGMNHVLEVDGAKAGEICEHRMLLQGCSTSFHEWALEHLGVRPRHHPMPGDCCELAKLAQIMATFARHESCSRRTWPEAETGGPSRLLADIGKPAKGADTIGPGATCGENVSSCRSLPISPSRHRMANFGCSRISPSSMCGHTTFG